jgi:hypothetical protein
MEGEERLRIMIIDAGLSAEEAVATIAMLKNRILSVSEAFRVTAVIDTTATLKDVVYAYNCATRSIQVKNPFIELNSQSWRKHRENSQIFNSKFAKSSVANVCSVKTGLFRLRRRKT